jgi:hypothetical protein
MVDPVSGPGGSSPLDVQKLTDAAKSGNFDSVIGPDSSLPPDSLALLKFQQKMALDQEIMQLCSQIVKDGHEVKQTMIRNS